MNNEMHHVRSRATIRTIIKIGGLLLLAAAPASCSIVSESVLRETAQNDRAPIRTKMQTAHKSYAYEKAANVPVSMAEEEIIDQPSVKSIDSGSPYICSPSGFGQKARCFLRS